MIYIVQQGDTLYSIARKFNTTVDNLLRFNVLCNQNFITPGLALLIPSQGQNPPRAGGDLYYIVQPGDTLSCIAHQFKTTVHTLIRNNQITNPILIFPGTELLVITSEVNFPEQLKLEWARTPDQNCNVPVLTEHGIYYLGSFEWASFGKTSIPFLLDLLKHRCEIVRRYAVISLGRLGYDGTVVRALQSLVTDPVLGFLARIALRRISLASIRRKGNHILINNNTLYRDANLNSSAVRLPAATEIRVLRWLMPSPTGEEGPRGGLQLYDYVQIINTGQIGFLPRLGLDEITFL